MTEPKLDTVLSWRQWKAAAHALELLRRAQDRGYGLVYTTASAVAVKAGCSVTCARAALHKLKAMGVLRSHPASGSRAEMFVPRAYG